MSELPLLKKLYDYSFIRKIFINLVKRTGEEFGLLESVVFTRLIDVFMRYRAILKNVLCDGIILDVGCGKMGIGAFTDGDVISLDIEPSFVGTASGYGIIASATNLPFKNDSISTLVSADCVEHLPKEVRKEFANESIRVSGQVLVHVPVKEFCEETDLKVMSTHRRLFGTADTSHLQHTEFGQPTIKEMRGYLPGCEIIPDQNRVINYIIFVIQRIPIVGWLSGLIFLLFLKRMYHKPPYYSCLFIWSRYHAKKHC